MFFCHGSRHSKGTVIMFNPSLDAEIIGCEMSGKGRIIILEVRIDNTTFVFANIYAPNDLAQQVKFFDNLKGMLVKYANENIIVNCALTPSDKSGGCPVGKKEAVVQAICNFCRTLDLKDAWRYMHPKETLFTWHHKSLKIHCRLDYFLVSTGIINQIKECKIIPVSFSDHAAVSFSFLSEDYEKRGPGFFKFNNSLLEDKNFVEELNENIEKYKEKYGYLDDKRLYWEMIKMEIRSFTLFFSKRRSKQRRNEEELLQSELCNLQRKVGEDPSEENVSEFHNVKFKLNQLSLLRTRGAIARSKARWCEYGERNSKYFYRLEKRNYNTKYITELKLPDKTTISRPKDILNEVHRFYKELYTSTGANSDDQRFDTFVNNPVLPEISADQKQSCEGLLTKDECFASLKQMAKGKSPGSDGLSAEFYLAFWESVGQELVDSQNYAFECRELTISQRRGMITLIPKKNKDKTLLDNWRPISLLNTDYKIATRAIASRISKILPSIIHSDQTGYVKKRFIGQNIRLISDVIERCQYTRTPGIALFLDFRKAFDTIEWSFLFRALKTFGFGDMLVKWIKTFYTNPQSCVTNNGFATPFFSLERGVRQGCPLYGILFVIGVELLAGAIRSDKSIKGLSLNSKEFKLSQYADDTTCLVEDTTSASNLFKKLDLFRLCSGLELNRSKTDALWLGSNKNRTDTPFGIRWPENYVNALGVCFTTDQNISDSKNLETRLSSLEKCLSV